MTNIFRNASDNAETSEQSQTPIKSLILMQSNIIGGNGKLDKYFENESKQALNAGV